VTTDDLSTPLGQETKLRKRRRLPFTGTQVMAAGLGLFLATFAGFALFHHDPLGGEPMARIALQPSGADGKKASTAVPATTTADAGKPAGPTTKAAPPTATGQRTITIIDGSSGARQDVVVSGENAD
jgi:hypothetical protein